MSEHRPRRQLGLPGLMGTPPPVPVRRPAPPRDEAELLARAESLAGRRLGDLAARLGVLPPRSRRQAKGWAGQLLEVALGATAASAPAPDFEALGVELKTLPVDPRGVPRESTHVCAVPLTDPLGQRWQDSLVRRKLARVLWVPIVSTPGTEPTERRIASPLLWSPGPETEAVLKADWEELMEMVALGRVAEVTARQGTYLQIRPKAASSRSLVRSTDAGGRPALANPRGFYLRASFTRRIMADHFILDAL